MLKAPAWCPDAVPTLRGWEHPTTGEVLKSALHTRADIAEWHSGVSPAPKPAPVSAPRTLNEAPSVERALTEEEITHHGLDEFPEHEE